MDIGSIREALGAHDGIRVSTIPTGVYSLDAMIGGGFPNGRCVSLVGKGGSGKSTLLYSYLDKVAEHGGVPILIDNDVSYTKERVLELGFEHLAEKVIVMEKSIAVESLFTDFKTILGTIARAPGFRFGAIAIDTFSNMPCNSEMESGTPGIGMHARFSSSFFRSALSYLSKFNITMIFVLHDKVRISTMPGFKGGYTYLAQNAIFANSFLELHMARTQMIKVGGSSTGFKVKAEVRKNKIAPPFREVSLDYFFSLGYDKARSLLDGLISVGLAKKAGAWYDVGGERMQVSTLRANPHLITLYEEQFYEAIKKSPREIIHIEEDEDILSQPESDDGVDYGFPVEAVSPELES